MRLAPIIFAAFCFSLCTAGNFGCKRSAEVNSQTGEVRREQPKSLPTPATTPKTPTLKRTAASLDASSLMDPRNDGWDSEAFAELAKKTLAKIFATADQSAEAVAPHVDAQAIFQSPFASLDTAYRDGRVIVRRPQETPPKTLALGDGLREFANSLSARGVAQRSYKIVGVNIDDSQLQSICLYEGHVATENGRIQHTATLDCTWQGEKGKLRLSGLTVVRFEEVELTDGVDWFVDETDHVLAQEPCYSSQLQFGGNFWMQRIERAHGMDDSARNGLAIGDANGDGFDDIYLCQPPGLPNRLLLQQKDGSFRDHAARSNLDFLDQTSAALFIDLDNDGDQDLVVGSTGSVLVMRNDGSGIYTQAASLTPQLTDVQSLAAADYDLDGDVDLFVCVYREETKQNRGEFVFHDALDGGQNYLFRNDLTSNEAWRFTDVSQAAGLAAGSSRYTLAAAWEDYDNDGDPDLYLANDYGPNALYRNDGGVFTDATASSGLIDTGFGMSADWGDYNRDGQFDLYVGNMFSSAGSRITSQPGFQEQASAEQREIYRRMAQGNSLFAGTPQGTFQDNSQIAQVQMGRWAWSSLFADLNNDGWEDLVVANGYITAASENDL